MLRSTIALVLIFLMAFAFSGYMGVFKLRQFHVRKEVKTMLKAGAPDSLKYEFYLDELENSDENLTWMHDKEFRYQGDMYDVLTKSEENGRTVLYCVKDVKESGLFAELDRMVSLVMHGNPAQNQEKQQWVKLISAQFIAVASRFTCSKGEESALHISSYQFHCKEYKSAPTTPPPRLFA